MKISIVFRNKDETKPLWFEKMKEKISNYVTRQRRKTPVCSCRDFLEWNAFSIECACQDEVITIFS